MPAKYKYYAEYQKEYRAKNKKACYERHRKWVINNREKRNAYLREYSKKRRYAARTTIFLSDIPNYESGICGICSQKINGSFDVDHIIPLSRNGVHDYTNLQITHPTCNRTKNNKLQHEMEAEIAILKELMV